ncbi:hypothetical protein WMY93_000205 [Mugilogobius chulae]|uniref:Leucine-rich repeat-containing protein 6 n=1 Tax=Mugilogobius chulae TaxID=88201 RepID=A0AAW0Q1J7_9GOBI
MFKLYFYFHDWDAAALFTRRLGERKPLSYQHPQPRASDGEAVATVTLHNNRRTMVYITEELVRRRAEHNDGEMFSLEELSLHQQDIQKIQHLEQWCRELRILYLQNNLISTIENVGRLKKLQYLNLALNNIELIETWKCAVSQTQHPPEELFLLGNPCADFQGYRQYVLCALPQLQVGRIRPETQRREELRGKEKGRKALNSEVQRREGGVDLNWRGRREKKEMERGKEGGGTEKSEKKGREKRTRSEQEQAELDFWQTPCSYTPESRLEAHKHLEEKRRLNDKDAEKTPPPPRTFVSADGRVLNANEPKLDFCLTEDEENNTIVLDLAVYRHLDTSLIDVDVQPSHVRILVKGKVFQMVLPAEVRPDSSSAQRSQVTGHLVLTMPRAEGEIRLKKKKQKKPPVRKQEQDVRDRSGPVCEKLEVDSSAVVDFTNIVPQTDTEVPLETTAVQSEPSVSPEFVDDPDVPPLM